MSEKRVNRASYTMKFKINAVKYAKETNVSEASRKFEVDRKRIREWVSHFDAGKLQEHFCLGVEGSLEIM